MRVLALRGSSAGCTKRIVGSTATLTSDAAHSSTVVADYSIAVLGREIEIIIPCVRNRSVILQAKYRRLLPSLRETKVISIALECVLLVAHDQQIFHMSLLRSSKLSSGTASASFEEVSSVRICFTTLVWLLHLLTRSCILIRKSSGHAIGLHGTVSSGAVETEMLYANPGNMWVLNSSNSCSSSFHSASMVLRSSLNWYMWAMSSLLIADFRRRNSKASMAMFSAA